MENDLEIWEMAQIFEKCLRCKGHGLSIGETALLGWKWLKNLTIGLNTWELTYICVEWLK